VSIKHFDQKQLADRWGISPKTLERWRWLGQDPKFLKLGGRIAYRLEDIEAFEMQQLRQVTGSAEPTSPTPAVPPRPIVQRHRWDFETGDQEHGAAQSRP
jgi:helix-turn-helix protein